MIYYEVFLTNFLFIEIESNDDEVSIVSETDPQLSTLPSPGGSVISDVDSNVESLSTDVLVKSFHAATEPPRGMQSFQLFSLNTKTRIKQNS